MSVADVALSPIRQDQSVKRFSGFPSKQQQLGPRSSESIMIYISVSGSVIPLRVLESDSIASVKLRIQTCKGYVVKRQKLVFGGRELARSNSLVKEYGVGGGNVLHLVLKLSDLLLITVRSGCGEEYEIQVDRNQNVGHVKRKIAQKVGAFRDVDIHCNGEKLDDDQRLIDDVFKDKDAVVHLVVQRSAQVRAKSVEKGVELSVIAAANEPQPQPQDVSSLITRKKAVVRDDFCLEPITVDHNSKWPSFMCDMIKSTYDGLAKGNEPIRSSEGTGGTYLMPDQSGLKYVSVFKPTDEEPMAVNNPHGYPVSTTGEGLKRGTRVGEGAIREVAAYILDHPQSGRREKKFGEMMMGFAGVPPTCMVKCLNKGFNYTQGFEVAEKNVKVGSLQMFMNNCGSCEDIGPGSFPVEEVHKISVLDIRLANADRHAANILRRKGEDGRITLIPIDHGYCLPVNFEDCTFDWLYWPQAKQPYPSDTVKYINSLDAEEDIALLKHYGWDVPRECGRTLRLSTMLLKKGVERGLTPFAIGSMMSRETLNKESVIEEIVREAEDSLLPGMPEAAFLETVSQIMDSRLDNLPV